MLRSIILIFDLDGVVTRMRRAQDDRLHVPVKIGYENGSSSPFCIRVAACISDFSGLSERIRRFALLEGDPAQDVNAFAHVALTIRRGQITYQKLKDLHEAHSGVQAVRMSKSYPVYHAS